MKNPRDAIQPVALRREAREGIATFPKKTTELLCALRGLA
jgi:hypothetical protein